MDTRRPASLLLETTHDPQRFVQQPPVIRGTVFLLLLLALATALLRIHFLDVPLERDEGAYAYIAQRLALGEVPYKDSFDQKPPGAAIAYWTAFRFGPETARTIHVLGLVVALLSSWALTFVVRRLADDRSALAAGLVLAFLLSDPHVFGFSANTELFMTLPAVLSVLPLLRILSGERGLRSAAACGVLNGIAFLFKPVAVFNMAFCVLAVWLFSEKRNGAADRRILLTVVAAAAFFFPILSSFLIFAALGGGGAYIDAVFVNNYYYASTYPWEMALQLGPAAITKLAPTEGTTWALAAAIVAWGIYRRDRKTVLLCLWLAASCLGIVSGKRFYPHYFIQWLPPLAAMAGIGVGFVLGVFKDFRPPVLRYGVSALFIVGLAWIPAAHLVPWLKASTDEVSWKSYPGNPFVEAPLIARFAAERTEPDDAIFIIGSEPEILFYAHRKSASRYIHTYPVLTIAPDGPRRLEEYVTDFIDRRPRMVILVDVITSLSEWEVVWRRYLGTVMEPLRTEYTLSAVVPGTAKGMPPRLLTGDDASRFVAVKEYRPAVYIFERR